MKKIEHQMVGEMYKPNKEVLNALARITLVQIIGPTAVGKSTLINEITAHQPKRFSEVGTITTRKRRESDSDNVTSDVSPSDMRDRIKNRELVQYFEHPSGDIYATDISSYKTEICLLPTMADSANDFLKLGFKKIIRFGVMVEGEHWRQRLLEREGDEKFDGRLVEALNSLERMRAMHKHRKEDSDEPKLLIVENNDGDASQAAQCVIDAIEGRTLTENRPRFNNHYLYMMAVARSLQENGRKT